MTIQVRTAMWVMLALVGCGGDKGPAVPARCKPAWDNLVKIGAAGKGDAQIREYRPQFVAACPDLTDAHLACLAGAAEDAALEHCMDALQVLANHKGDRAKSKADGVTCRDALQHAAEVYEASSASAEEKAQMRANFEPGVKACEDEHPPTAVLTCTMAAKSVDELIACDQLRR